MFYVLYDTFWFIVVYISCYKCVDIVFRDHSQALKPIAGIDANVFNYNMEDDMTTKHNNIFWSSSPLSFFILTINPFIHSIVYLLFSFMFNVVDLNRILYYVLLFKLANRINLFTFTMTNKESVFILLIQLVFIIISYTDISSVVATLFQLIDESTDIGEVLIIKLLNTHDSLIKSDTSIKQRLYKIKVFFVSNRQKIYWVKFLLLSTLFIYNLLYVVTLSLPLETLFCYYSIARVVQTFSVDLLGKKA